MQRQKSFKNKGTKCKRSGDVFKEAKSHNAKIERPSYHKTWDGDKALIKPFLSSHVGITPDLRSDTTLSYARLVKGWGGGGGGGGVVQLMGFEIIGARAQDASLIVGIKNGPSTSNRPLIASPKCRPEARAQLASLKD